ncbi:MAG: nuclease [Desulfovibrionales bacterium]|nr:nuclease [Desulfovibrionales bacterium]
MLLGLFPAGQARAESWRVRVAEVLDGDTLLLGGGERLRLRGIDAPELGHNGKPGQYFGRQSKRMLEALVSGRELILRRSELDRDRHGRMVGIAWRADNVMVNLSMIEQGAAFVYPHAADRDKSLSGELLQAQRRAMSQGKGFWPHILGIADASRGCVGTRSSLRFHILSCSQGRKVKKSNQVQFSSLAEAFAAGFAPARDCTPWPPEKAVR